MEISLRVHVVGISEDDPNAVVVGLAPSCFNYDCMNHAFRLLMNGVPLIAIHKARYYKNKDGLCLGPGMSAQIAYVVLICVRNHSQQVLEARIKTISNDTNQ